MKLDGIIDNVYFKQSIRSNTDNVSENDMKNFIEFIKKETPKKMQSKIYIHSLYALKNNRFEGENRSIINKFKVILSDDNSIKIATMDKNHKGQISTIHYDDIEKMDLKEVDDKKNPYYEAYRLTIYMKDRSKLILDTSTSVSQIRKDMDRFLNDLKENIYPIQFFQNL